MQIQHETVAHVADAQHLATVQRRGHERRCGCAVGARLHDVSRLAEHGRLGCFDGDGHRLLLVKSMRRCMQNVVVLKKEEYDRLKCVWPQCFCGHLPLNLDAGDVEQVLVSVTEAAAVAQMTFAAGAVAISGAASC